MLKALIVEDEFRSREALKILIEEHCKGVKVAGLASTIEEGVNLIQTIKPDILFLDIELHPGTGFDLLKKVEKRDFQVIFTTAYEQYAIDAIKANALDYLLKPIDIDELQNAVERVIADREKPTQNQLLENLLSNLNVEEKPQNLALKISGGVKFIKAADIHYCEADGAYTHLHLNTGEKFTQSKNLKEYEEILDEKSVVRVHHSYIININYVDMWQKSPESILIMKDGTKIGVSVKRREAFLAKMLRKNPWQPEAYLQVLVLNSTQPNTW